MKGVKERELINGQASLSCLKGLSLNSSLICLKGLSLLMPLTEGFLMMVKANALLRASYMIIRHEPGNEEIAYEGLTSVYEGDQRTQTPGTQITKAIHLYFY